MGWRRSGRSDPEAGTRVQLHELLGLRLHVPARPPAVAVTSRSRQAGAHVGRTRGRGMDYVESRAYQAGDDVRQIDWRLTARSGRMHTKLFQEERERSFMVLIDTHACLHFGTRRRFKSVQAARAAALAVWAAERAGERVGAMSFGRARQALRPRRGQHGALAVMGALVRWDDAPGADEEPLSEALRRAAHLLHGASQLLVITDGHAVDAAARAHLLQLRRRTDVSFLVVADALELGAPPPGRYPLAVGARHVNADLSGAAQRAAFQRYMHADIEHLVALCRRCGVRQRVVDTAADPLSAVMDLRRGRP